MNTPNPKCPRCKCYWKPDETDIKTSGLVAKTCKKCRLSQKKEKSIIKLVILVISVMVKVDSNL